ncbi:MAG: hypothetical protein AB7Q97_10040 [Gammaproteobacteria bacterium]
MSRDGVVRFLERTALDRGLRAKAAADFDRACAGFDLTAEEREALRRGDDPLQLIHVPGTGKIPVPGTAGDSQALAPVLLVLQVVPSPAPSADGHVRLSHAVSLLAAPGPGEPLPERPDGATPVSFWVELVPHATARPDGGAELHYSARIGQHDPRLAPEVAPAASPWDHRVDSDAARAAAAAVRAAPAGQRHARLLDLIDAIAGEAPSA